MSRLFYLASDVPLAERPNPHCRAMSVNEALALGLKDIPPFLLAEGFDRDRPGVLLWCDNNPDDGRELDDDFSIWSLHKDPELATEKKYCACIEWEQSTPGRAALLIDYLAKHLQTACEVELWHVWLDNDLDHRIRKVTVPFSSLTPDDIAELEAQDIFGQPATDYCYLITNPGK